MKLRPFGGPVEYEHPSRGRAKRGNGSALIQTLRASLEGSSSGVESKEDTFRNAVRTLLVRDTYPDYSSIRRVMGRRSQGRSGLKGDETRWRIDEMERAGYDWNASRRQKRLVAKDSV